MTDSGALSPTPPSFWCKPTPEIRLGCMNSLALRFGLGLGFTMFLSFELVSTLNHLVAHLPH